MLDFIIFPSSLEISKKKLLNIFKHFLKMIHLLKLCCYKELHIYTTTRDFIPKENKTGEWSIFLTNRGVNLFRGFVWAHLDRLSETL